MNSCELVSLITAASCAIANCVSEEDLPMVASTLGQIAATLATIAVNESAKKPKEEIPVEPDTEVLPETEIF